jgi:hypothetical protein
MAPPIFEHHPSTVLHQLSRSMAGRYDGPSVQLPMSCTWKTALQATNESLGDIDQPFIMLSKEMQKPSQKVRQSAARDAARDATAASSSTSSLSSPYSPLRIRTNIDTADIPVPKRSKPLPEKWKENARQWREFKDPYPVTTRTGLAERALPIVTGNVLINGIDDEDGKESAELADVDLLWDTGAHKTIITLELLPESFHAYLSNPIHDPYRSADCTQVQVDAIIILSNCSFTVRASAWVVPKAKIPNLRVGILFGERECIDRLHYESIPAAILRADGENVEEDVWGDIVLKRYLNEDDDVVLITS